MKNRVAAVVVTYNRCELLMKCLDHLLRQENASCDILVVDNASTDRTREGVCQMAAPEISYRNTGENLGGAGGFNFGVRWAVESGYEYIWLMDDDTLPCADALCELLAADELLHGNYGFLSSAVFWTDGRSCHMNRQKLRKSYYDHLQYIKYGLVPVESATFVSFFVRREAVWEAGLPIKDFFIWGDDIEYARRLSIRMGRPCFLVGRSCVTHMMAQNTGSDIVTDSVERLPRYQYAYRNENYTYRKEGVAAFLLWGLRCVRSLIRILFQAEGTKGRRCWILISGMVRGCFFHPEIEKLHQ